MVGGGEFNCRQVAKDHKILLVDPAGKPVDLSGQEVARGADKYYRIEGTKTATRTATTLREAAQTDVYRHDVVFPGELSPRAWQGIANLWVRQAFPEVKEWGVAPRELGNSMQLTKISERVCQYDRGIGDSSEDYRAEDGRWVTEFNTNDDDAGKQQVIILQQVARSNLESMPESLRENVFEILTPFIEVAVQFMQGDNQNRKQMGKSFHEALAAHLSSPIVNCSDLPYSVLVASVPTSLPPEQFEGIVKQLNDQVGDDRVAAALIAFRYFLAAREQRAILQMLATWAGNNSSATDAVWTKMIGRNETDASDWKKADDAMGAALAKAAEALATSGLVCGYSDPRGMLPMTRDQVVNRDQLVNEVASLLARFETPEKPTRGAAPAAAVVEEEKKPPKPQKPSKPAKPPKPTPPVAEPPTPPLPPPAKPRRTLNPLEGKTREGTEPPPPPPPGPPAAGREEGRSSPPAASGKRTLNPLEGKRRP